MSSFNFSDGIKNQIIKNKIWMFFIIAPFNFLDGIFLINNYYKNQKKLKIDFVKYFFIQFLRWDLKSYIITN